MKTVALGEVATIERSGVQPDTLPDDTIYLGLEHIERGGRIIGHATIGSVAPISTKFRFTPRHVLFGKLRPNLGKISRPEFAGICSTDILPILPGSHLDRSYLAHYLAQPYMVEYAATRTSGANLPRLSPTVLASFAIPLPPLAEQRRIATILDHADALRAKRHRALAHLDALPQAVFHTMFGATVPTTQLGEVATIQGGLQVSAKRQALPLRTPYLRVANVHRGRLDLTEIKTIGCTQAEQERTRLQQGDLLFVEGHANPLEVGRAAMWSSQIGDCSHQNHLIRARADTTMLLPQFALAWFNSPDGARHFRRAGKTTSGLNTISASTVRTAPLPVPPLAIQQEFVAQVARAAARRSTTSALALQTDELFRSLQSRAFKGEL